MSTLGGTNPFIRLDYGLQFYLLDEKIDIILRGAVTLVGCFDGMNCYKLTQPGSVILHPWILSCPNPFSAVRPSRKLRGLRLDYFVSSVTDGSPRG